MCIAVASAFRLYAHHAAHGIHSKRNREQRYCDCATTCRIVWDLHAHAVEARLVLICLSHLGVVKVGGWGGSGGGVGVAVGRQ